MEDQWAFKRMNSQPRLPLPGNRGQAILVSGMPASSSSLFDKRSSKMLPTVSSMLTSEDFTRRVKNFALQNPSEWEEYILRNTRLETLNKWISRKKLLLYEESKAQGLPSSVQFDANPETQPILTQSHLINLLSNQIEKGEIFPPLYAFSSYLQDLITSSGFNLYGTNEAGNFLYMYNPNLRHWRDETVENQNTSSVTKYPIGVKETVASYVAHSLQPLVVDNLTIDDRFPKGVANNTLAPVSVMCIPLVLPSGDLVGVVEFYRNWKNATYTPKTVDTVQNLTNWAMLAIHNAKVNNKIKQQSKINEFLLRVSRTYLDQITNFDNIVQHMMRFAKTLVSAERCSMFLLNKDTGELYSNFYDAGEEKEGETVFIRHSETRFSASKGIAGHAVTTKEIINVQNVQADKRFSSDIDKITGYTTNNILCVPIINKNEVYGVFEMINKRGGVRFTKLDQDHFQLFTVFCALALRYAKIHYCLLQDKYRYEVVKEQYQYHSRYKEEDYHHIIENIQKPSFEEKKMSELERFHFSFHQPDHELSLFFVQMLRKVTSNQHVKLDIPNVVLANFVLAVRNNYRVLPYHNWNHALTVCHTMFCILVNNLKAFDLIERFSLMIACLCHDIDHRTMSNQFLKLIEHPLSKLYSESCMENHHIQLTMNILNRENHDLLRSWKKEDKDRALKLIRDCILATDLASYFENQAYLSALLTKGSINITNLKHRFSTISLMMTACDINSTTKEWKDANISVKKLYSEFWMEGDRCKKLNFSLNPMMDRDLQDTLATHQVHFYSIVVIKCYETLSKIFPNCSPLEVGAKLNLEMWKEEEQRLANSNNKKNKNILKEEEKPKQEKVSLLTDSAGVWMVGNSRMAELKESKILLENM